MVTIALIIALASNIFLVILNIWLTLYIYRLKRERDLKELAFKALGKVHNLIIRQYSNDIRIVIGQIEYYAQWRPGGLRDKDNVTLDGLRDRVYTLSSGER